MKANYFERVKLLVEHGADVNRASPYPAGARAPYAEAVYRGHQEIADYLVLRGAKPIVLGTADVDQMRNQRREDLAELLRRHSCRGTWPT